jgi:homoserine kinase
MTAMPQFRAGPVTVSVPATSANLGPGFDTFGLALELRDEVTAEVTGDDIRVQVEGEGAGEVPEGREHLIVATLLTTYQEMGIEPPKGLRLACVNRIPHARGLGSSSAAIVAGIRLARALVDQPPEGRASLRLAARLEGHPDNVAPCLLGGFTIAWTGEDGARAVRLPVNEKVQPVVYVPQTRGLTAHARAALPESVPHRDAVFNAARSALLVHALTTEPELLLEATDDRLHQPYRAQSMPETANLVAELRDAGIAAFVSGAGPSVLALLVGPGGALPDPPDGWWSRSLSCSSTGARIVFARHAESDPVAAGPIS